MRVSVNLERGLFHCFTAGCAFSGNSVLLARQLGVESHASTRRRRELEERAEALRHRVYQETAAKFREKMAAYDAFRSRQDLLEPGLALYGDLLRLNAELLLLEVLSPAELCEFIAAAEDAREKRIIDVVSQDGVATGGKFYSLPPVVSAHGAEAVRGSQMTEVSWRANGE
jgi:hypothetical protein